MLCHILEPIQTVLNGTTGHQEEISILLVEKEDTGIGKVFLRHSYLTNRVQNIAEFYNLNLFVKLLMY
jgi:hypothetical protein